MTIDVSIIQKYLSGEPSGTYSGLWIYDGGRLFEEPSPKLRANVAQLLIKVKESLANYSPANETPILDVFPNFYAAVKKTMVFLVVGLKDPYDMMMDEYDGQFCVILDLIRLLGYGADFTLSVHEFIHVCLHERYPQPENANYREQLDYIAFDEGFAHVFAYMERYPGESFNATLEQRYEAAKAALEIALEETDEEKQRDCLYRSQTGYYWDKFAAIAGKLYLLKNAERMKTIYDVGWKGFADGILCDEAPFRYG